MPPFDDLPQPPATAVSVAGVEARLALLPDWLKPDQVAALFLRGGTQKVRQLRDAGKIAARDFRLPSAKVALWRFYSASMRENLLRKGGVSSANTLQWTCRPSAVRRQSGPRRLGAT